MHEIIMGHGQGLEYRIAETQEAGWNDAATRRVSGMSYNYCEQLAAYNDDGLAGAKAGDRVPDAELAPRIRLFDLTRHTRSCISSRRQTRPCGRRLRPLGRPVSSATRNSTRSQLCH